MAPEQIDAAKKEQEKVDDQERGHQKSDPGLNRPADSADEEERRAR